MQSQSTTASIRYVRGSRDPNQFYVVALNPRGFWECSCPAAKFNRAQPCKHTRAVAKDGAGLVATPKRPARPLTVTPSAAGREMMAMLDV